ncbi:MAG: 7-carboxy-7-deazaguanine synthase QueE [Ignavibacteriae bacterium]|nr:7-carboxy-7-deazaguanine synthase QueE [Ignavibacteriota bacterium]
MIKINEIFYSIQGESSKVGLPCIFIRLTFCNLRCTYCDTEYSFYEGMDYSIDEILAEIKKYKCNLVEITGGEPLVQKESLELMEILCDNNYEVMLETGGSLSIENVDKRVKIILDFKTPSSKMEKKNFYNNINFLKPNDEIKFVIGDREDFEWSKNLITEHKLDEKCEILFSSVFGKIEYKQLSEWILEENLNVRFQIQLHKHIWEPNQRGV